MNVSYNIECLLYSQKQYLAQNITDRTLTAQARIVGEIFIMSVMRYAFIIKSVRSTCFVIQTTLNSKWIVHVSLYSSSLRLIKCMCGMDAEYKVSKQSTPLLCFSVLLLWSNNTYSCNPNWKDINNSFTENNAGSWRLHKRLVYKVITFDNLYFSIRTLISKYIMADFMNTCMG